MSELSTRAVTFLFTDVEGSTRLWERDPQSMGAALARHDAILREVIEGHGGRVFATTGDAFCAAFRAATDALVAAYEAQLALARAPWPANASIRVRMALHTGLPEARDDDYFGPPLNRTARLLAIGHGGQVLLSSATHALVLGELPPGSALRDMGERRLKDLTLPERVFQLVGPGLAADFPPLASLDARSHNLPIQLTSLVGRERELSEVKAVLRSTRLVTLTGTGGAGKTRLSLQVGADVIDDFADGVWFVELAPLADERLVPQAVAAVLGIKEHPGTAIADTLARECRDKALLLVLDNCEHLVAAAARLCVALLHACAGLHILASSREALRVPGETVYRVPSLPTPEATDANSVKALTRYAAVRLFVERAAAARPSFRPTDADASALASICRRLDGIPLALELAAARLRSMSLAEVDQRLDERFRLLTSGPRTALPRQQTLRALIDWSYDLLDDAERAMLRRLAVFAGGWSADAAEHVCGDDGIDGWVVLDLLGSLVDKSLAQVEERERGTRYRLLETVRQYARERLLDSGEEARWRNRHVTYFLALAERAEAQLTGPAQKAWFEQLESEHDNLRFALAWCSPPGGGDPVAGLRLASALYRFWYVRSYLDQGRRWLSALLAAAPVDAAAERAKALRGAGTIAWMQGDYDAARSLHEQGLAIQRRLGDRHGVAMALTGLGTVASDDNDYAGARAAFEESLAVSRETGDRRGIAVALTNLGVVAYRQGDYAAARAAYGEGLPALRELGDRHGAAMALNGLGLVAFEQQDLGTAESLYDEGLQTLRELGDRQGIAMTLNHLGMAAAARGDSALARVRFDEGLAIWRELDYRPGIASALSNLGDLATAACDRTTARANYEASLALLEALDDRRGIALLLPGLAASQPLRIACILGGAQRMCEEIDIHLPPHERARFERQLADARAAAGDDAAFERAWQEGRAMTVAQIIAFALRSFDEPGSVGAPRVQRPAT